MEGGNLTGIVDLGAKIRPGSRLLGLDIGAKTIGLALSDAGLSVATPLKTIRRRRFREDLARLQSVIAERDVGGLVIGLPINMDGSEGPRCQSVRQFAKNIDEKVDLPTGFWDERLSTAAVTRTLLEADVSRKRRGEVIDKMAAAYILQGALDRLHEATRD
jgi:putative Holliday junction resolvase